MLEKELFELTNMVLTEGFIEAQNSGEIVFESEQERVEYLSLLNEVAETAALLEEYVIAELLEEGIDEDYIISTLPYIIEASVEELLFKQTDSGLYVPNYSNFERTPSGVYVAKSETREQKRPSSGYYDPHLAAPNAYRYTQSPIWAGQVTTSSNQQAANSKGIRDRLVHVKQKGASVLQGVRGKLRHIKQKVAAALQGLRARVGERLNRLKAKLSSAKDDLKSKVLQKAGTVKDRIKAFKYSTSPAGAPVFHRF